MNKSQLLIERLGELSVREANDLVEEITGYSLVEAAAIGMSEAEAGRCLDNLGVPHEDMTTFDRSVALFKAAARSLIDEVECGLEELRHCGSREAIIAATALVKASVATIEALALKEVAE